VKDTVRRISIGVGVVVSSVYVYMALRGPQGIPALQEKWRVIRTMQLENADLEREVRQKRDRIQRLRSNPAEQELEIRQRLKLLKPGETSFILPEPPKEAGKEPAKAVPSPVPTLER
jgi:cell division protein FtsB